MNEGSRQSPGSDTGVPLCTDLDGTLIRTDVLWESLIRLIKQNPLCLFALPVWLLKGRANLKREIASRADIDVDLLPCNEEVVEFLRESNAAGRPLVLATAADEKLARRVAERFGFFQEVFCSDGRRNLRGSAKARLLAEKYGKGGFDYAGDSPVDLPVWECSREAIVVTREGSGLEERARKVAKVARTFPVDKPPAWRAALKALRPHQWVKNFIIFVPLAASHQVSRIPLVLDTLQAFVAFSLAASATYIFNDLLDLESDRHHSRKKHRVFAAGKLSIAWGLVMAPVLAVAGFAVALAQGPMMACTLLFYIVCTTAYSHGVKRIPLADVFVLAALYTVRLIAGHVATGVAYSNWLLMFSMFIFLSLALVKRFVEVAGSPREATVIRGRGYIPGDSALLAMLGIGNGLLAVMVFALYANSVEVLKLYKHPSWLLLMCPLLLYWISRVWMLAYRGQLHDDPVVFALKDKASYVAGLMGIIIMLLAAGHGSQQ